SPGNQAATVNPHFSLPVGEEPACSPVSHSNIAEISGQTTVCPRALLGSDGGGEVGDECPGRLVPSAGVGEIAAADGVGVAREGVADAARDAVVVGYARR